MSPFLTMWEYMCGNKERDFQGYRSKNFVSYLPKLICICLEVKTHTRYPGKLLVITHNIVKKF